MTPNVAFGILNIVSALLLIGVSIPLVKRKIKMNHLYGIRVKKAFESDANWYDLNAYGGRQLIIWSLPLMLMGLICFFIPIGDSNKDLLALVLGVMPISLCLAVPVIKIVAYAKKI